MAHTLRRTRRFALATALALVPFAAEAHLVSTRFGELYSGLLHPLTTLLHLVPWACLGLLAGLQRAETSRWVPLAFPLAVVAGLVFSLAGSESHIVTTVNVLSFVVLGGAVALAIELPRWGFLALVALFGITHGFANAAPGVTGYDFVLYATGLGLAAYLWVTLVSGGAFALAKDFRWGTPALRALGSWVAAAGTIYLALLTLGTSG